MTESIARTIMTQQLCEVAKRDERIVGLIDYGSSSQGYVDAWSDIDVAVILRDADCFAFKSCWRKWAAQFGELLLVDYIEGGTCNE